MQNFIKGVFMACAIGVGFGTIMVSAVAVMSLFGFAHPENWPGGAMTYYTTLFGWCFWEGPMFMTLMAIVVATSNLLMGKPISK